MSDLISVIIPTYNRAYCIEKSIYSVLNQTYSNLELIIVDDCSTDDTTSVINSISDNRLRYIKLEKNSGPSFARNFGVKMAKGNYVAFHDSDDIWHLDKLEKQYELMQFNNDCDMVFCKYKTIELFPRIIPAESNFDLSQTEHGMLDVLLTGAKVGTPTIFIKKTFFTNLGGFNEKLKTLEDWELSLRIARFGKICFLNEVLVDVFPSENGVDKITDKRRLDSLFMFISLYWNIYRNKEVFSEIFMIICNIYKHFLSEDMQNYYFQKLNNIDPAISLYFPILLRIEDIFYMKQNHINNLEESRSAMQNHINNLENQISNLENQISFEKYKKVLIKKSISAFCDESLITRLPVDGQRRIIFYGAGEVAQTLIPLCKKSGISIPFVIDRNPKIIDGVPSCTIEQISNKTIPVCITTYDPEETIRSSLEKIILAPIYYLDEIF